jgi:hypothetical protein
MVDTLLLSLELESFRRSTVEFTKLVTRRFRRHLGNRRRQHALRLHSANRVRGGLDRPTLM